jgi:hypothetical protein
MRLDINDENMCSLSFADEQTIIAQDKDGATFTIRYILGIRNTFGDYLVVGVHK